MGKKDKIVHKKVKGSVMEFRSVSLPAGLVEDLKLVRDCYRMKWYGEDGPPGAVSYEKVFERLLSRSGFGHVDPEVFEEFIALKNSRNDFGKVVTSPTKKTVDYSATRAEGNDTAVMVEAASEQERVEVNPETLPTGKTEKRFVHPDGRWYPAAKGDYGWIPVNTETGRWMTVKSVKDQGFELKDVSI